MEQKVIIEIEVIDNQSYTKDGKVVKRRTTILSESDKISDLIEWANGQSQRNGDQYNPSLFNRTIKISIPTENEYVFNYERASKKQ